MTRRVDRAFVVGAVLIVISFCVYLGCAWFFHAKRPDLFYLADAFLHGRTWLDFALGPADVIPIDGRYYVPFAPFPAIAFMPLVAILGPETPAAFEALINSLLAAFSVGMCWWMLGRFEVARLRDRFWLLLLFGFSTQVLWVTTRGGVWHTGHLIAISLTLGCLIEWRGRRRAWLIGLMAGAAFLTRAPLAFALPFYALLLIPPASTQATSAGGYVEPATRPIPWRAWLWLAIGTLPSVAFFFLYNQWRFGSPFESGYALATLPEFLELQREQGLFSLVHVPMNLDYLFFHLPTMIPDPPFFRPDGLGLSIVITSPGLLYAIRAPWRRASSWILLGAAVAVLIPSLLYYGGGWLQYGFRYFLDSTPFVIALCASAAAARGAIGLGWRVLILFGVVVMFVGVYWVYAL